jgi:hypothetical protein
VSLLKIFITISLTTAEPEIFFSKLNGIMGDSWLNFLVILAAENEMTWLLPNSNSRTKDKFTQLKNR